jgi:hypothetical protein
MAALARALELEHRGQVCLSARVLLLAAPTQSALLPTGGLGLRR